MANSPGNSRGDFPVKKLTFRRKGNGNGNGKKKLPTVKINFHGKNCLAPANCLDGFTGHGKPAPSLARAPLFWRWGLARRASRNNFPGDGQSFCDSLPRTRFRRFGAGGWPDGLPETSFRAMKAEGSLAAMAVLSTRSGQVARSLNSGRGWPISYCPV